MSKIIVFAPAILVLVGAILVAVGTFWSGFRQSHFNAEIRKKNEQITKMQEEDIATLRGADYLTVFINDSPNDRGQFGLVVSNSNNLPIYDVYLVIRSHVDMPMDTPEQQQKAWPFLLNPDKYEIGNIAMHGVKDTRLFNADSPPGLSLICNSVWPK